MVEENLTLQRGECFHAGLLCVRISSQQCWFRFLIGRLEYSEPMVRLSRNMISSWRRRWLVRLQGCVAFVFVPHHSKRAHTCWQGRSGIRIYVGSASALHGPYCLILCVKVRGRLTKCKHFRTIANTFRKPHRIYDAFSDIDWLVRLGNLRPCLLSMLLAVRVSAICASYMRESFPTFILRSSLSSNCCHHFS